MAAKSKDSGEMVQGTLDMLILRTLVMGPAHGHTIAHVIEHASDNVLEVEQGSLYPALHRLEDRGWLESYWAPAKTIARQGTTSSPAPGESSCWLRQAVGALWSRPLAG